MTLTIVGRLYELDSWKAARWMVIFGQDNIPADGLQQNSSEGEDLAYQCHESCSSDATGST